MPSGRSGRRSRPNPRSANSHNCSRAIASTAFRATATAANGRWSRKHGIAYEAAPKPKSDLYRELLPSVNSKLLDLVDHPKLVNQLASLERRTARGGRDSIDHPPGCHDDVANAIAGAIGAIASGVGTAWLNLVWD